MTFDRRRRTSDVPTKNLSSSGPSGSISSEDSTLGLVNAFAMPLTNALLKLDQGQRESLVAELLKVVSYHLSQLPPSADE